MCGPVGFAENGVNQHPFKDILLFQLQKVLNLHPLLYRCAKDSFFHDIILKSNLHTHYFHGKSI